MKSVVLYTEERMVWKHLFAVKGIQSIYDKRKPIWVQMLRKTFQAYHDMRDDEGKPVLWHPREIVSQATAIVSITDRKFIEEVHKLLTSSDADKRLHSKLVNLQINIGGVDFSLENKAVFLALGILFESNPIV